MVLNKKIPKEIVKFYESLENLQSQNIWNIQRELKPSGKIEGDWNKKIILERKILNYNLSEGQLYTNVQATDINGRITQIKLTDFEIKYLKIRLKETTNT